MPDLATGFDCRICHHHHPTLPLSFSVKAPDTAIRIPLADQQTRVVLSPDQCVIDNTRFYLRGRIVLPIIDLEEPFIWGVWAEVGPRDFLHTQQHWKTPGREAAFPFRGWLDTELSLFPPTTNLEVRVQTQPVGRRPHLQLLSLTHPLAQEQRTGIPLARVQQIAETLLHDTAAERPAPDSSSCGAGPNRRSLRDDNKIQRHTPPFVVIP